MAGGSDIYSKVNDLLSPLSGIVVSEDHVYKYTGGQEIKPGRIPGAKCQVEKNETQYKLGKSTYSGHVGFHRGFFPQYEASLVTHKKVRKNRFFSQMKSCGYSSTWSKTAQHTLIYSIVVIPGALQAHKWSPGEDYSMDEIYTRQVCLLGSVDRTAFSFTENSEKTNRFSVQVYKKIYLVESLIKKNMKIAFLTLFLAVMTLKSANAQETGSLQPSPKDELLRNENVVLKQKVNGLQRNNRILKKKNAALNTENKLLINKITFLKQDSTTTHIDLEKNIKEKNRLADQYNADVHSLQTRVTQLDDSLKQYVSLESEIKNIRMVISDLKLAMRSYNLSQNILVPKIKNYFIFNQSKYNFIDGSANKVWAQESIEQLIPRRLIGQKKIRTKVNYTLIFRVHPLDPFKTLMDVRVESMKENDNDLDVQSNQMTKFQNRLLKNIDTLLSDYLY
ncbi:hypothetical protein Runsl_3765 [Runella slithyformis DSM 19594]|uniref:Uncharacterized protein n=2 Tax=Runella TaxID=105 RepID=A0A7U3ZN36_RUNSL|nr:hypothetical protein Runsl_3765 [Runella slithyformis DSM 19594]